MRIQEQLSCSITKKLVTVPLKSKLTVSTQNLILESCNSIKYSFETQESSFKTWESSFAKISETMNNHLSPSNLSHIFEKNQNDCFSHQASYKISQGSLLHAQPT